MHQYPSDISREEYEQIREALEGARKKTRPREYDLYDVFCAVLYVVQGGIQVRNVEQSVFRGGPYSFCFKSFNPPASRDNWANKYVLEDKPGLMVHHSTYKTTPEAWLGPRFLSDAEHLLEVNPTAYRNEYGGEATGTGGNVFKNLELREITDKEIARFDRIYQGVDWGWYPDPFAFIRLHY